jgi:hypothetical protein
MNIEKQLRRLAKLGITDFETTEDIQKVQTDMLRRLERSSLDPGQYVTFADCGPNYCGHKKCREACWFGTCHRRLQELPAIYDLLKNGNKPLFEVRYTRGMWARPSGQLRYAPIAAAKKLNRRALDKLFMPSLVAVGLFRVSVEDHYDRYQWIFEIHEIVAGASREELERVFPSRGRGPTRSNSVWLREVTDLGQALSRVFRRDLDAWSGPARNNDEVEGPTKRHRRQFYKWLLDLRVGARLVRYGCDQYFNKLHKKPRTYRAAVRKPRPYPYHLKPYMFGCREDHGEDKYDPYEIPEDVVDHRGQTRKHLYEKYFPFAKPVNKKRYFDLRPRARRRLT